MKKLILAVVAAMLLPFAPAAKAETVPTITYEMVASVPRTSGIGQVSYSPLRCDGTDVLSGDGQVRFQVWATSDTTVTDRWRRDYFHPDVDPSPDAPWYNIPPTTLPAGERVLITDIQQDLDRYQVTHTLSARRLTEGPTLKCQFDALNIPTRSHGAISHRLPYEAPVTLRFRVENYADQREAPCGTDIDFGRMRLLGWATSPVDQWFHGHWHQESAYTITRTDGTTQTGAIGPNQDADPRTGRAGEESYDFAKFLQAGVETKVLDTVTSVKFTRPESPLTYTASRQNGFHFMQQHGPGQAKVEKFCLLP